MPKKLWSQWLREAMGYESAPGSTLGTSSAYTHSGMDISTSQDYSVSVVDGFRDACLVSTGFDISKDAPVWAKWIDRVDTTLKNGWCFEGEFINEGTVEIPQEKSKLILAMVSKQDDSMRTGRLRQFRVIRYDPGFTLTPTHISTDDRHGGWALRIRDLTANLLQDIQNPPSKHGDRFSMVEIS